MEEKTANFAAISDLRGYHFNSVFGHSLKCIFVLTSLSCPTSARFGRKGKTAKDAFFAKQSEISCHVTKVSVAQFTFLFLKQKNI